MSDDGIPIDPEVEAERIRRLEEFREDASPEVDWADQFGTGSFGEHELLDRSALMAGMVEQTLLEHPACLMNPEWFALADRAVTALNALYQRVGEAASAEEEGGDDV